jgi:hypothetical protein
MLIPNNPEIHSDPSSPKPHNSTWGRNGGGVLKVHLGLSSKKLSFDAAQQKHPQQQS